MAARTEPSSRGARARRQQPQLFAAPADDAALTLARSIGEGALVAGLDEAGRGPLAGPVVAAACVLPAAWFEALPPTVETLNDSKKLSEGQREDLFAHIVAHALAWGVAVVGPARIDEINILRASLEAMAHAFEACEAMLRRSIQGAVVDGNMRVPLPPRVAQRTVVGGDASSRPIMAASILAKVTRDRHMRDAHLRYPGFGFDTHKGYGTPQHLDALARLGPSPIHRRSFAPVRAAGGTDA